MRSRAGWTKALLALVLVSFLFPARAHAYLDPGTGSYIFQIALATLVGTLFALRLFWGRLKSFFKKLFSKPEEDGQGED
ncbi:MAG: hypothetical protein PVH17_05505 [Anaerolineae bacterium]